jgi:predicted DNA binding protein
MSNNHNLRPFKKGESGNPKGRPKGSKNRATIVREIFDSISVLDSFKFNELESRFPHIKNDMSIEYLLTLIQVNKAIFEGDTRAYKVLMDSLYGTPIRQIDLAAQIKEQEDIVINYNKPVEFNYEALTSEELRILLKALDKDEITK